MLPSLMTQFAKCRERGDHLGAARLLAHHPELAGDREWARFMIHIHARAGEVEFVRALLDAGVDVNIPEDDLLPDRPIASAVSGGSTEVVRLLLARGSDVNWGWGGGPFYCVPLATPIREGRMDIVRMLVEAGALLNVIDRAGQTPLSWAVANSRTEIIAYLRSKGAKMPQDVEGYKPPPPVHPIDAAVGDACVCVIDDPLVTQDGIELRFGAGPDDPDKFVLFTRGMADHAMTVPTGGDTYRHAELILYLADSPCASGYEMPESEVGWHIDWMLKIARYPFDHDTWLGGKWTIISNEDPPQPLSEFTEMTCWLLLGEKEPLARAELPDGKSVCFYTLMPIHTAERDLALSAGLVALLERFAEHDVPVELDPDRKSVVPTPKRRKKK